MSKIIFYPYEIVIDSPAWGAWVPSQVNTSDHKSV